MFNKLHINKKIITYTLATIILLAISYGTFNMRSGFKGFLLEGFNVKNIREVSVGNGGDGGGNNTVMISPELMEELKSPINNLKTVDLKDAKLILPDYAKILDGYSSMAQVKTNLKNLKINKNKDGYTIVMDLLKGGYNGFDSNKNKENFFKNKLQGYIFQKGQQEYIMRVTHSLWLEGNKIVPWSLISFSKDEIKDLFWVNELHQIKSQYWLYNTEDELYISLKPRPDKLNPAPKFSTPRYTLAERGTAITDNGQEAYKLFLLANKLKLSNINKTIEEVIIWQKKNFFHAYWEWGYNVYYDNIKNQKYHCSPFIADCAYPNTLERFFDERVSDCHLNAFVFANLLRSLNISAIDFVSAGAVGSGEGHGIVFLPTINKYVHGDHIADFVTIPATDYLISLNDITDMIDGKIIYYDYFKVKFPAYYNFTNSTHLYHYLNLFRSKGGVQGNNKLYIQDRNPGGSYNKAPVADWNIIKNQVKEYNLSYKAVGTFYTVISDYLPIKTLEILSQ